MPYILFKSRFQQMEKMLTPSVEDSSEPLIYQDWGLIDYQTAVEKQLEFVEEVATKNLPGYLIFCSHPPIVTTGRATQADDIFDWQGDVIESSRGGRATYHGPSQVVVYPILNLKFQRRDRKEKEIVGYLRVFENAIVDTLKEYGIESQGRSLQKKSDSAADETGVWVETKKIASLGIAVKKWVTYHGAAINFSRDEKAFKGINPCGFSSNIMTTVEDQSPNFPTLSEFKIALAKTLLKSL
jgi:lipoyl(octanoyl) transferase